MSSAPKLSPGVQKYVDDAQKLLAERDAALARMKTMKFDTIAVHGLYSVEEALQAQPGRRHRTPLPLHLPGLPRLRRARGRPGLPRPDLVLHADRQPDDLLPRVGPGPARRLPDGRRHVLLRHGLGHGGHRRRPSIPSWSSRRTGRRRSTSSPASRSTAARSSSSTSGKTKERGIEVPLGPAPRGHRGLEVEDRRGHPLPLHGSAEQSPAVLLRRQGPGRPGPLLGHPVHHRRDLRDAGPDAARSPTAPTSSSTP